LKGFFLCYCQKQKKRVRFVAISKKKEAEEKRKQDVILKKRLQDKNKHRVFMHLYQMSPSQKPIFIFTSIKVSESFS